MNTPSYVTKQYRIFKNTLFLSENISDNPKIKKTVKNLDIFIQYIKITETEKILKFTQTIYKIFIEQFCKIIIQ